MKATVKAFAKINLFLDMVSKREDGYHNILSLMQSVSLHDTVCVDFTTNDEKSITLTCNSEGIPCDKTNLAYRAADIYPYANGDIKIAIEKRIPVSAGLAGGSTDAAAVLFALNKLCGEPMALSELKELGAKLGADVPFCIECGSLLTEGIGEKISPFVSMPKYPIVIAKKGEGMSTPAAYKRLDEIFDNFEAYRPNSDKLDVLHRVNASQSEYCDGIFNIFECAVEPQRPCVTEIKHTMKSCGAINATMSGSGTSVFGIFESEGDAMRALTVLLEEGADAHLCYPCDSSDRIIDI